MRECMARLGLDYEIDRLPDMPFHVDLALNLLPGIMIGEGTLHGSRNRRTRKHVEDGTNDANLILNLKGAHLIEQRNTELVLGDGEAVTHDLKAGRKAWVQVARGSATLSGEELREGDGVAVEEAGVLKLVGTAKNAEILLFDFGA